MLRLILFLISFNCLAIDDYIDKKLQWSNTGLADDISDGTMMTMMFAPYYFSMTSDRKVRNTTITSVSMISNWLLTDNVKMRFPRERPDKSNNRSFFSGHTSTAFTSAGLLCSMKKYCTEALILAATTGYLRIAARKHYFSDVIVGAGIGFMNGRYIPTLIIGF